VEEMLLRPSWFAMVSDCNNADRAKHLYTAYASSLHTSTKNRIHYNDPQVVVNGLLEIGIHTNPSIYTCWIDGIPGIAKVTVDKNKQTLILNELGTYAQITSSNKERFIVKMKSYNFGGIIGILMPRYVSTLNAIPRGRNSLIFLEKIVDNILQALNIVHNAGLCHSDIKPENIFMDFQGNYFLGDFDATVSLQDQRLTRTTSLFLPKEMVDQFKQGNLKPSPNIDFAMLMCTVLYMYFEHYSCKAIAELKVLVTECVNEVSKLNKQSLIVKFLTSVIQSLGQQPSQEKFEISNDMQLSG
jgi:serine/threonine protein kinase